MIVVFVIDTSPSMSTKLKDVPGMSKLDLAKMMCESLTKKLTKRLTAHSQQYNTAGEALHNMGLLAGTTDKYLLLSTTRQYGSAGGAGGRLLVGYSPVELNVGSSELQHQQQNGAFDTALKQLHTTTDEDSADMNTAVNVALSLVLQHRLSHRTTENYGMGRLTNSASVLPNGSPAVHALQPACIVVLSSCSDQEAVQLQANSALREFYQEAFRWDQRIFGVTVGDSIGTNAANLEQVCHVTGGTLLHTASCYNLSATADELLQLIAPSRPKDLPLRDPLTNAVSKLTTPIPWPGSFIQGGPVVCFQALEADAVTGGPSLLHRSMLLYVPTTSMGPVFTLPESHFPAKKLDTLPPRLAQPLLTFSTHSYGLVGSDTFDPMVVMKQLSRLDQLVSHLHRNTSAKTNNNPVKLLHRDTYLCEWSTTSPSQQFQRMPVGVRGAGRSLTDTEAQPLLNIGILCINADQSTLTVLPPEPHILLPLLLKAVEVEHRVQKQGTKSTTIPLDESWRSEWRAYMFRIPAYYYPALKRALRPILHPSLHSILITSSDSMEAMAGQCFSAKCLAKIRAGEAQQKEYNERTERQERELRRGGGMYTAAPVNIGYGQYDVRASTSSYLAALRTLPAPWKVKSVVVDEDKPDVASEIASSLSGIDLDDRVEGRPATQVLGDLPADCLMAYYESRRRWIFGGSGLTTRNVFCEGVCNDGSNSQRYSANTTSDDEPLLASVGVGVSSLNKTSTVKMGDYRERLLWTRAPVVGWGANDSCGVAATTAADGSPVWSVDDNALPLSFFDPKTGEFTDSVQTRVRSRLIVHFGNPFKDKRGNSIIPEAYADQRPPRKGTAMDVDESGPMTPPGSPPHDSSVIEGEGEAEAIFASPRKLPVSPPRTTTPPPPSMSHGKKRDLAETPPLQSETKRLKKDVSPPSTKPSPETKKLNAQPEPPKPPRRPGPPPPPVKQAPPPPPGATKQKKVGAPLPPKPRPPGPPPTPGAPRPKTKRPSTTAPPPKGPPKAPKPPGVTKEAPKAIVESPASATKAPAPAVSTPTQKVPPKKPETAPAAPVSATAPPPADTDVQSPDKPPTVALSPGWMSVWSKSQKRWYFFDTKSNKSVWQWPPPASG